MISLHRLEVFFAAGVLELYSFDVNVDWGSGWEGGSGREGSSSEGLLSECHVYCCLILACCRERLCAFERGDLREVLRCFFLT